MILTIKDFVLSARVPNGNFITRVLDIWACAFQINNVLQVVVLNITGVFAICELNIWGRTISSRGLSVHSLTSPLFWQTGNINSGGNNAGCFGSYHFRAFNPRITCGLLRTFQERSVQSRASLIVNTPGLACHRGSRMSCVTDEQGTLSWIGNGKSSRQ